MAVPPPPPTRVDDVVDVLHGLDVADPYRWLEDGEDPEVRAWSAAQNAHTRAILDALPGRAERHARLTELLRIGGITAPAVAGDHLFALERHGDLDQTVLTVRPAAGGEARTLVDPRADTGDDTAAIDWYAPSDDGALVAVGTSTGGDELSTLAVVGTADGTRLDDRIPHTRAASVAWAPDGAGFAYTRYPAPGDVPDDEAGYHRHVRWHDLGTDPADDPVLFDDLPDPTAWASVDIDRAGHRLVISLSLGWSRSDVHLLDRRTGEAHVLVEGVEAVTSPRFVAERVLAVTTLDADRGRVVEIPVDPDALAAGPDPDRWRTLVAESDEVIEGIEAAGDELLVATAMAGRSRLWHHRPDGTREAEVAIPASGALTGLTGARDEATAVVGVTSFGVPAGLWRWRPGEPLTSLAQPPTAPDPDELTVEHTTYPAPDGTDVPMYVIEGPTTPPGDDAPCVLSGYGGFAIAMSPAFSAAVLEWCRSGGRWAVAGIRGGAEHGEAWHRAGMLERKAVVFDDFAAAADHLVATGRARRDRFALRGGSNGGLLVGAVLTRRPDVARAVHCAVPLLDMVRYHRFRIARLWIPEFGDPDDPDAFTWLHGYSPYHRVVDGTCYPAVLLTTAEEDSRVDPLHARKMAARLQAATACGSERPILVRIEERAGHGQGKPASRQADELADALGFLADQLRG